MDIKNVVVIGSGTMGSGIAAQLCNANVPVTLLDLSKEADNLDHAVQEVLDEGLRTKDIISKGMKEVSTSQMGDAIISKLK